MNNTIYDGVINGVTGRIPTKAFTVKERELAQKLLSNLAWRFSAITGMSFRDINQLFNEILEVTI